MKVLLIDDEEDIRKIGRLSLEAVGHFETSVAGSVREGFDLAGSNRPDVILMDMMMPDVDGITALAELETTPELNGIPVIVMTAKAQPADITHYLECGAVGVVKKPFDPMTLPGEIIAILENAQRSCD